MITVKALWSVLTRTGASDAATARREYITRAVLLSMAGIAIFSTILGVPGLFFGTVMADTLIILLAMDAFFAWGWYVSGKGLWKIARCIPVFMFFLGGVYGNYIGGMGTPALLLYSLSLMFTAMLFSRKALAVVVASSLLSYCTLAVLHHRGMITSLRTDTTSFHDRLLIAAAAIVAFGILLRFLVSQLETAARISRNRESELAAVNEELQSTIERLTATNDKFEAQNEELLEAIEQVEKSEHKYRSLVESINEVIFSTDETGSLLYVSPAVRFIIGIDPGDMIGRNFIEFIYAEDIEKINAGFHNVAEGILNPDDYRLITATGGVRWVSSFSTPIFENGEFMGLTGVLTDINNRKLAEQELIRKREELEESNRYNRILFADSRIPKVVLEPDTGMYTDCNDAAVEIYGYSSREEILGKRPLDFSAPYQYDGAESSTAFNWRMVEAVSKGSILFQWRHRREDGTEWDAEVHLMTFRMQGRLMMQFTLIDITKRLSLDKAVRDSEALFRTLIESSPLPIVLAREGSIFYANRAFGEMVRVVDDAAFLGTHLLELIAPEERERVGRYVAGRVAGGDVPLRYESIGLRIDGTRFPYEITVTTVELSDGPATLAFVSDISDRRQSEVTLKASESALRSLLDAAFMGVGMIIDRRFKRVNASLGRITGYSEDELLSGSTRMLYSNEEEYERVGNELYSQAERTGLGMIEGRLRRKDGVDIDVLLCMTPFYPKDLAAGACVTMLDITDRKRADEALREREVVLRSILDSSPTAIALVVDRRFRQVNASLCRITGYSEIELLERSSRMIYPDDEEYERVGGILYGEMRRVGMGMLEARLRRKDGADIDVLVGLAAFDPNDLSAGACITMLDITERKRTEVALREREGVMRSILEATPAGVGLLVNRRFKQVNGSLCRMTGYAEDELLGRLTRILYPDDDEYLKVGRVLYEDMLRNGVGIMEVRLRRKEGSVFSVLLGLAPFDPKDLSAGVCATVLDITERKRAEETIRTMNLELERKVQDRTDELRKAYDIQVRTNCDLEKALRNLSDTQQQLVLSEKLAALGQLAANMAHELNTPLGAIISSNRSMTNIIRTGLAGVADTIAGLNRNEIKWFAELLGVSLEKGADINRDIDRKTKRYIRDQLNEAGVKESRALSEIIADMGIHGYLKDHPDLLKKENIGDILKAISPVVSMRKLGEIVAVAAEKASHVVGALRSYLRQDDPGELVPVDLKAEIDMILTLYHNKLKYGVSVKKGYGETVYALGNRNGLNQVWINLINNALQAMDYRGSLEIRIDEEGGRIVVSIIDSGPGIPHDIKDRVFEPFFTTKKHGEGIGLGLDICRKIVHAVGGTINFESVPGRTVFSVLLEKAE